MSTPLPIYEGKIKNWDEGIANLSLVQYPANEHDVQLFSKEKKAMKFSVADETRHLLLGLIMQPDYPIYRRDGDYEYMLMFSKETIVEMAERMISNGWICFDIEHDGKFVEGIKLQQVLIKDKQMGILPTGFEDVADGSLMCVLRFDSIDAWEKVTSGEVTGVSLEGYFSVEPVISDDEQEILDLIEKLKNKK